MSFTLTRPAAGLALLAVLAAGCSAAAAGYHAAAKTGRVFRGQRRGQDRAD